MKKFNYRVTVNIHQNTIKLGLRAKIHDDLENHKIRVQAIFQQRQVERRYPMEIRFEEEETGPYLYADAEIELPYVFYKPPKRNVTVTFSLWCDMQEILLTDQPFPIRKEQFSRDDLVVRRNIGKFILGGVALPILLLKEYFKTKDMEKAKKKANSKVYNFSGYSFSPRQRKTDYFAIRYQKEVKRNEVDPHNVMFLSERLPEKGGNLLLLKEYFSKEEGIRITEFVNTKTVDALTQKELRECAQKCAKAAVIILEDFYPQIHRLKIRSDTKVVQLWHACGAFKTFGLTRIGKPGGALQSSMNHRNYDFVSVSSEAIRSIYAEAFGITRTKVKALGVPRTDVLFDEAFKIKKRAELYEKYPAWIGKKIILFAPTFRGDGNKDAYYPREAFEPNQFMKNLPQDVICIIKHHPFVSMDYVLEEQFEGRVFDLTGKDMINDLLLVTDLLITDYSSSVFEAAILQVPMLFYAFDKKEYIESRDFYCDYDHFVPGFISESFGDLQETTTAIFAEGSRMEEYQSCYQQKSEEFYRDYLSALDGNSTERIGSYIKEHYLQNPEEVSEESLES